jgi:hypothetical protein
MNLLWSPLRSWYRPKTALLYFGRKGRLEAMRFPVALILLATMLPAARQKQQPDVAIIHGNAFESPFFRFHYSFPPGWSAEDNQVRMDRNRVEHENVVGRTEAEPPPVKYYGSAAKVFWTYDLLLATPPRPPAETKSAQPYIRLCALERISALDSPGKYARLMVRVNAVKMLHEGQKQTISGRKFVRTDVIAKTGQVIAMFETLTRDYLLLFEFHARDEREMNELAQTMSSLAFEK